MSRIHAVTGRGAGELLEFPGFTLRVIHGFHADLTHPEQQLSLDALRQARAVWERDEPPLSREEEAHAAAVLPRGSMAPEVFTEGTMCLIIDIDGYRIVYRDSGGPVSAEERAFFAASPGCDLAIAGFIGRPLVRRAWSALAQRGASGVPGRARCTALKRSPAGAVPRGGRRGPPG